MTEIGKMTREELQAGIERLRARMERLKAAALANQEHKKATNGHTYPLLVPPRINGGARFKLPDGMTVNAVVDEIIRLQNENHMSLEEIAPKLKLAVQTIRKLRNIVMLVRRDDLTSEESALVQKAINDVNITRRIAKPWREIENIAFRVWGKEDTKKLNPMKRRARKRFEQFENAISFLANTAESAATIKIPADIAIARAQAAVARLEAARKSLEKLKIRIRKEVQREF